MNKLDRLLNKADQFKESGKFKEALSTLTKANKLSPNDPYVYLSYAVTFDLMEQFEYSIKYYSMALNIKENDPKILTQYGITLCRINRVDEAINIFIRSICINPDYSLSIWHLAIAYKVSGLYEEAIKLFEQCMTSEYDQYFDEIHYQLGLSYFDMGWTLEAIKQFNSHIEIVPEDSSAYLSLGNCYFDLGWLDEAIGKYKEIIGFDPEFIPSYNSLAFSYAEKGWYSEALDVLREAQKIAPEDQSVRDNMDYIESMIDDGSNSLILLKILIEICKLRQRHESQNI